MKKEETDDVDDNDVEKFYNRNETETVNHKSII